MLTSKVPVIQAGLDFLRDCFKTQPLVKEVYVFGSVANHRETEDSDIDLAVVSDDRDRLLAEWEWWLNISLRCPVPVEYTVRDLGDVRDWETIDNWESRVKFYERES